MNEPAVVALRFLFVLVEINELVSVEVDEELMFEREIGVSNGNGFNVIAPNLIVGGRVQSGINEEMKVVQLVGIITYPAHAFLFVEEQRGEGIDERIIPPGMFHEFSERELSFNRAIEDLAIKTVLIANNGHKILTQGNPSFRTKKRR